jgi:hypothetical protein
MGSWANAPPHAVNIAAQAANCAAAVASNLNRMVLLLWSEMSPPPVGDIDFVLKYRNA